MGAVINSQNNDKSIRGLHWQLGLLVLATIVALLTSLWPIQPMLGTAALCVAAGIGIALLIQQWGDRRVAGALEPSEESDYRPVLRHFKRCAEEEPGRVAAVLAQWLTAGPQVADTETDTGDAEQAAVLLMLLAPGDASRVLRELPPQHVQQVVGLMSRLAAPGAERVEKILHRFQRDSRHAALGAGWQPEQLRDVLADALGEDKAALLRRQLAPHGQSAQISKLKWLSASAVVDMLRREHPQIQAVMIAWLEASQAAQVLMTFERDKQDDLLARLAALESLSPAALEELDDLIAEHLQSADRGRQAVAGERIAAALLNELDVSSESQLLDGLRQRRPELAERVEERMFNFEHLARLSGESLQLLLEQFEPQTIHLAIQGSAGELREKMLVLLKTLYPHYHPQLGRADLLQIKRAQQELLVAAKRLAAVGEVVLERRTLAPVGRESAE